MYCSRDRRTKVYLALQPFRSAQHRLTDEFEAQPKENSAFSPSDEQRACVHSGVRTYRLAGLQVLLTLVRIWYGRKWQRELDAGLKEPYAEKRFHLVKELFDQIEEKSTKSELQPVDENVRPTFMRSPCMT